MLKGSVLTLGEIIFWVILNLSGFAQGLEWDYMMWLSATAGD